MITHWELPNKSKQDQPIELQQCTGCRLTTSTYYKKCVITTEISYCKPVVVSSKKKLYGHRESILTTSETETILSTKPPI